MRITAILALTAVSCLGLVAPSVAQQWVEYRPADGAYRIEFPGQPKEQEATTANGKRMHLAIVTLDAGTEYAISVGAVGKESVSRPADEILDKVRDALVKATRGTLHDERSLTVSGVTARRFAIEAPEQIVHMQILVKADVLYQLIRDGAVGHEDNIATERFLDSFQFLDN